MLASTIFHGHGSWAKALGSRDRYEKNRIKSKGATPPNRLPIVIPLKLFLTNKMPGNSHFKVTY